MSKIYVVSYDFKEPTTRLLQEFTSELKKFGAWWHFIDGTWLIKSELDAKGIYARLKPHIDNDVNLLILEAGTDAAGLLPRKAWDWIRQRMTEQSALKGACEG